jgi:hypothetical protein
MPAGPLWFEWFSLGIDNPPRQLTEFSFRFGDGEKGPPVTATGADTWPAMANAETNGETENG